MLVLSSFSGREGERFRAITGPGTSVDLELIEVSASPPVRSSTGDLRGREEPFSLLFRGPRAPSLVQRIHELEHEALGKLEIFIVPIGPDELGLRYQAIFN